MVLYDITLFIYRQNDYITVSSRSVYIKVTSDVPCDKYSKRIKKYSHIIDYQERTYKASNYHITVYDDNAYYYKNILKYNCPKIKVVSIDLFFNLSDTKNTHPLVIGVNQENEPPVYYTYEFLIYYTAPKILFHHSFTELPDRSNSFGKEDLITRLIEESDKVHKRTDGDRMVIMLDDRTSDNNKKYPKTGPNKDRISILKSTLEEDYFDKYEHKINTKSSQKKYYLCYGQNTLYISHVNVFSEIRSVEVYYNQNYGKEPIIIVLKTNSKNKLYKYLDFKEDLQRSKTNKDTGSLAYIEDNDVEKRLKEENDKINPYWPYLIDKTDNYCYQVKVKKAQVESGLSGFTKYTHEPQTGYLYTKSIFLYKGEKLIKKTNDKFEPIEEIESVTYTDVTVYFGTRDPNIPLIIQLNKSELTNNKECYAHKKDGVSYWNKLSVESIHRNEDLLKILKETESDLFDSILLLVDFVKDYDKNEVENKTGVKVSGSQPNSIKVSEDSSLQCLNDTNYKCYKHHLSVETKLDSYGIDNIKLKLFLGVGTYRHGEITLYNSDDTSDFNIDYVYYEKKDGEILNDFYVIFYCENKNMDPRPVLLCYKTKVYMPLSLEQYSTKWIYVKNVEVNSECTDSKLLETLRRVSYFMNPVYIEKTTDRKIGKSSNSYIYTTHIFNNSTFIQITIKPEDLRCYRKYTHSANYGHVLGEISHNGSKLFVNYEEYEKLFKSIVTFPCDIIVYYYMYDKGHNYPLLVCLRYSDTGNSYFKLTCKNKPLKWVPISESHELELIKDDIEDFLYNTRYNLDIKYEKNEDNLIIETSDRCNETNSAGIVGGVLSTFALVAVGIAGAFYKFPKLFRSVYIKIRYKL